MGLTMKLFLKTSGLIFLLLWVWLACRPPVQRIDLEKTGLAFFRYSPEYSPIVSAHRGGPLSGYPENCIETFEYTVRRSCSILECDIRKTKDGKLILMHDHTLDRTTSGQGKTEDFTLEEIKKLYLKDPSGKQTGYRVPTLEEALIWSKDKARLTLDIKPEVDFDSVIAVIHRTAAKERISIITYSATDAQTVYRIDSTIMISVSIRKKEDLIRLIDYGIPSRNFIAYTGSAEPDGTLIDTLHRIGVSCIVGTMGNLDNRAKVRGDRVYYDLLAKGADVIATDNPFDVDRVIRQFTTDRKLKPRCTE